MTLPFFGLSSGKARPASCQCSFNLLCRACLERAPVSYFTGFGYTNYFSRMNDLAIEQDQIREAQRNVSA